MNIPTRKDEIILIKETLFNVKKICDLIFLIINNLRLNPNRLPTQISKSESGFKIIFLASLYLVY